MTELSGLMEKTTEHNTNLRKENELLAEKLKMLIAQYEEREGKVEAMKTEWSLQVRINFFVCRVFNGYVNCHFLKNVLFAPVIPRRALMTSRLAVGYFHK